MTRREREIAYWDDVAAQVFDADGLIKANIHKAEQIVARILENVSMISQDVLEVGVGAGLVAGVLNMLTLGNWKYIGTDLSPEFAKRVRETYHINAVHADVTKLPGEDGQYTRIICLDSLEHVHPDDREAGYAELARVAKTGCVLIINMPLWEGFHDKDFDHPFGPDDFARLKKAGFELVKYEAYSVPAGPNKARPSGFVLLEKV